MPSTAIRRVFYRAAARELDVEFITGRVYRYSEVPEAVATGFARYRSKGAYFNRALRDRFKFEELDEWQESDSG